MKIENETEEAAMPQFSSSFAWCHDIQQDDTMQNGIKQSEASWVSCLIYCSQRCSAKYKSLKSHFCQWHSAEYHVAQYCSPKCWFAEYHILPSVIMLNVTLWSVILFIVVQLNALWLTVIQFTIHLLNAIMMYVVLQNAILTCVILVIQ